MVADVEQVKEAQGNSEKMLHVSPVDLAKDVTHNTHVYKTPLIHTGSVAGEAAA